MSPNEIWPYGTMIISRFPCNYYQYKFKTKMHRSLILTEACLPQRLIVATSHFESMKESYAVRCEQLETTLKLLNSDEGFAGNSVVVGDFNFQALKAGERDKFMKTPDSNQVDHEEKVILKAGYEDVMHHFVGEDAFTYRATKPGESNKRIDKVVMQRSETITNKNSAWRCASAKILGSESRLKYEELGELADKVNEDGIVRTPSDHMAILAELTCGTTK